MPAWLLPAIMAGSSILGRAAGGSSDRRQEQNDQTQRQNQLLAQLYGTNQAATLNAMQMGSNERLQQGNQEIDRRNFQLRAPGIRASQAARGALMQNARSASFSGLPDRVASRIPTLHGGLNPDEFLTPEVRAFGGELTRQAIMNQLQGDDFEPFTATNFQSGVLPLPQLQELERSGLLEQIMASLGLGASLVGGVGTAIQGARRGGGAHNNYPIDPMGGG